MTDRLTYVLEHQFSLADSVCDSRVQNTIRVFFSRRAIWPRPGKVRLPRFSWIVPATTCLYCWSVFTDCYGCYGKSPSKVHDLAINHGDFPCELVISWLLHLLWDNSMSHWSTIMYGPAYLLWRLLGSLASLPRIILSFWSLCRLSKIAGRTVQRLLALRIRTDLAIVAHLNLSVVKQVPIFESVLTGQKP